MYLNPIYYKNVEQSRPQPHFELKTKQNAAEENSSTAVILKFCHTVERFGGIVVFIKQKRLVLHPFSVQLEGIEP